MNIKKDEGQTGVEFALIVILIILFILILFFLAFDQEYLRCILSGADFCISGS